MTAKDGEITRTHPEGYIVTCRWYPTGIGLVYEVWEETEDLNEFGVVRELDTLRGRLDTKVTHDRERLLRRQKDIIKECYPVTIAAVEMLDGRLLLVCDAPEKRAVN